MQKQQIFRAERFTFRFYRLLIYCIRYEISSQNKIGSSTVVPLFFYAGTHRDGVAFSSVLL